MAEEQKAQKQDAQTNFKHIVRIANVDIPGTKAIRIALTNIKGIGINLADVFCTLAGVSSIKKTGNLTDAEIEALNKAVKDPATAGVPAYMLNRRRDFETGEDKHLFTGTLNFAKENDIKRMMKTKSYKGLRHSKKLPVRGQRTRSNFRRSKGKVVGVKKKGKK